MVSTSLLVTWCTII